MDLNSVQGVWGTWAMGYRGMGHIENGAQGQWVQGVWGTWAMGVQGAMGYGGMEYMGNGSDGDGAPGHNNA